jgi:small subunit ribosomal protein S15
MARMHTKKHGNSQSLKPMPDQVKIPEGYDKKKVEQAIETYAQQGMTPAMIGLRLKKEHGVLYIKKMMGKRLVQVMKEKKLSSDIPADMLDLMKKAVNLHKHLEKNKQDKHNTTGLHRVEAKISRLGYYYIRKGDLPAKWKYDPREAELIIKGRG